LVEHAANLRGRRHYVNVSGRGRPSAWSSGCSELILPAKEPPMVWETRSTRRSEADRLTDKFTTSLTQRDQRAQRVRRLVNEADMSPDLAREVVDARMRQSRDYVRIARRGTACDADAPSMHAHARPRAPGTAHLRCGLGDSGWTTA
jgi:hypothetical protein